MKNIFFNDQDWENYKFNTSEKKIITKYGDLIDNLSENDQNDSLLNLLNKILKEYKDCNFCLYLKSNCLCTKITKILEDKQNLNESIDLKTFKEIENYQKEAITLLNKFLKIHKSNSSAQQVLFIREESLEQIKQSISNLKKMDQMKKTLNQEFNLICPKCNKQTNYLIKQELSEIQCKFCDCKFYPIVGRLISTSGFNSRYTSKVTIRYLDLISNTQKDLVFTKRYTHYILKSGDLFSLIYTTNLFGNLGEPKILLNYTTNSVTDSI